MEYYENYAKFNSKFYSKEKIYFDNPDGNSPFIYHNSLYFPKEMLKDNYYRKKKVPGGLINIGGVCYMNALLQCFYYCLPLTNYFLNIDEYQKNKFGLVSHGYYDFVKRLNSGDIYAAKNFKEALITTDKSFSGNGGKDSKDLAIFILSELHEELKENESSVLYYDKSCNRNNKLDVYKEKLNLDNFNNNKTIISKTFDFYMLLEQRCRNYYCQGQYKKSVYNIQNENIIIFELENVYKEMNLNNLVISIEDCLLNYKYKKIINCPFCHCKKFEIIKSICTLPKIFIFVMNRGKNAKFNCKIKIKKELDMSKYYNPIDVKYKEDNTIYDLICSTFVDDWCRGYKHEGHTIALCKNYNNGNYYIFNDTQVSETNINEIYDYNNIPYILFYERR